MGRHANPDIRRAFQEFQDTDTPSKCNKVRCLHCGYVRAKNTTRQIEHLQECQAYQSSAEAQAHVAHNPDGTPIDPSMPDGTTRAMLNGTHPNPNLQVHRRGPNQNKRNRDGQQIAPHPPGPMPPPIMPSLCAHLLNIGQSTFTQATQQPFLAHAGSGTLAIGPLSQWMVQDGHYARGYVVFIGQLLSKIRLPAVQNSQFHPLYRILDLLISALNNIRREISFFEITATKYGIQLTDDPPNNITRAYLDLFISSSSPSASLLEGLVVLWATEHCYRTAWMYAASFMTSLNTPATDSHIVALHQSLIPNWTAPAFSKFVEACRGLVDELANSNTSSNGKEEMDRCEQLFRQVCWLEERFWPDVDGMGEEDESGRLGAQHAHGGIGAMGTPGVGSMGTPGLGTTQESTRNSFSALNGIEQHAGQGSA